LRSLMIAVAAVALALGGYRAYREEAVDVETDA
jgi:hypothetical protein